MTEEMTEKQEIQILFVNYLLLCIFIFFVLTLVSIVICFGLLHVMGLTEFSTPKQIYISSIIMALMFAAYVYATYSTLNSIITEYHRKVAAIIEMRQVTSGIKKKDVEKKNK